MEKIQKIKNQFKNKALFEKALTHRSYLNEIEVESESNERLEFLGDAVLEFVVSNKLFNMLPDKEEGFLTNLRANIVNTTNLAQVAATLMLSDHILVSKGEKNSGGQNNPSLMADTIEAIIGALFIDSGLEKAQALIEDYILVDIDKKLNEPLKDPKSRLQEEVQAKKQPTPHYKVVSEAGPDHAKEFEVAVQVAGNELGIGKGKSKSEAEQKAAEAALVKLSSKQ